jgi:hypothetical protein
MTVDSYHHSRSSAKKGNASTHICRSGKYISTPLRHELHRRRFEVLTAALKKNQVLRDVPCRLVNTYISDGRSATWFRVNQSAMEMCLSFLTYRPCMTTHWIPLLVSFHILAVPLLWIFVTQHGWMNTHMPHANIMYQCFLVCILELIYWCMPPFSTSHSHSIFTYSLECLPQARNYAITFSSSSCTLTTFLRINFYAAMLSTLSSSMCCGTWHISVK